MLTRRKVMKRMKPRSNGKKRLKEQKKKWKKLTG